MVDENVLRDLQEARETQLKDQRLVTTTLSNAGCHPSGSARGRTHLCRMSSKNLTDLIVFVKQHTLCEHIRQKWTANEVAMLCNRNFSTAQIDVKTKQSIQTPLLSPPLIQRSKEKLKIDIVLMLKGIKKPSM